MDNSSDNSGDGVKIESDINHYDNDISSLREQQLSLLKVQHKAENRLIEARQAQEKMLLPHCMINLTTYFPVFLYNFHFR